eukprot:4468949-Prymnesium_polylepis.1
MKDCTKLAPLIAYAERVKKINLNVLSNLYCGKLRGDRSKALAYCELLHAIDLGFQEHGDDEVMEDEAGDWLHALLEVMDEAVAQQGMPTGYPGSYGRVGSALGGAGGGGGGHDDGSSVAAGDYEKGRHKVMREGYGFSFSEAQYACRSQQSKIKKAVTEEFTWPSEEVVPYTGMKDAAGGKVVDGRHVPVMGDDGSYSWKKIEEEASS